MKTYCQKCGGPTEYSVYKPKFCSACGLPLNSTASSPSSPVTDTAPVQHFPHKQPDESSEIDEQTERIPLLSKLDIEIDASKPRSVKFGEIAGTKADGEGEGDFKRGLDADISSEDFRTQFMREAGSLKQQTNHGTQEEG